MKLEKAIEILNSQEIRHRTGGDQDYHDAIKLGIEALKEIQHLHESQVLHEDELLPGETPEEEVEK